MSMPPDLPARKRCFAPVVDERTRLLVLGSLPGEQSLQAQQYYANPRNQFWLLMSDVMGADLVGLAYPARLETLLRHGVGLWDVVAEANRPGSLDSQIRDRADNNLPGLLQRFPRIQALAFNGGTAAQLGARALREHAARYRIVPLPSSSPAHTLAYAQKLAAWRELETVLS